MSIIAPPRLNLPAYMPKLLHERKNSVLLFLPQAHSFARAINSFA